MTEPTIQVSQDEAFAMLAVAAAKDRIFIMALERRLAQAQARIAELEQKKPDLEVVK